MIMFCCSMTDTLFCSFCSERKFCFIYVNIHLYHRSIHSNKTPSKSILQQ
jgi:hypothetical protein